jgi:hypothetical protein
VNGMDYSPRFATCEARLRLAGASCATISDSGSRYFQHGRDLRIRVADHPSGNGGFWHQEIRVDEADWRSRLDALLGPLQPRIVEMPHHVYFSDHGAWSQSMLKTFSDRRRLAHDYYVAGTHSPPEPKSDRKLRFDKGTALHTALLEPHRFDRIVSRWPDGMLSDDGGIRTKEAKAYRDEQTALGRIVLKDDQFAAVKAMAESVKRVCAALLEMPSRKEHSIYWQDKQTGLPLKMRLDWLLLGNCPVICDVKSTGDVAPQQFRKVCESCHYGLQQSHYKDGGAQVLGIEPLFYFIAVEDTHPFSCAIHQLDDAWSEAAARHRRSLLQSVQTCTETGDWSEPWEQRINTLECRPYQYREESPDVANAN